MIACLTVLLRSVGFCNVSIRPAIFLLITGKPNSCKISVFGFPGRNDITPSCLCTLIMLLSSRDDTDTAGTLIPIFLRNIISTILSNPPTLTCAFIPLRSSSCINSLALNSALLTFTSYGRFCCVVKMAFCRFFCSFHSSLICFYLLLLKPTCTRSILMPRRASHVLFFLLL